MAHGGGASVVVYLRADRRDPHPIPIRRSSDLIGRRGRAVRSWGRGCCVAGAGRGAEGAGRDSTRGAATRSEERTAEFKSQFHLVCRLLPGKKNVPSLGSDVSLPPSYLTATALP